MTYLHNYKITRWTINHLQHCCNISFETLEHWCRVYFFQKQQLLVSESLFLAFFQLLMLLRVFVFPGPRPSAWLRPSALATNFYLPALAPNLCLPALAPNFYLPALAPNFYLPALASPEPGLAYTNLVPPICICWPWPTIFYYCALILRFYLLIYNSSSGSSNINNSSNFLGLDNTHISMPILVN